PFARATTNESLLALQAFMGVASVTILVLSAVVAQRRKAEAALRQALDELDQRVQDRTIDLSHANAELVAEIDERRRAEERLLATRRELHEYIDNMSTCTAKLDSEGNMLLVNRTAQ